MSGSASSLSTEGLLNTVVKVPKLSTAKSSVTKYYYCPITYASFFRPDGMRLVFVQGVHATDLVATINYLDAEISGENGDPHPYLSIATEEQVTHYKMFVDPRGTLEEELRPKIEAEMREKLEEEIRNRQNTKGIAPTFPSAADEEKLSGIDRKAKVERIASGTGLVSPPTAPTGSFQQGVVGSDKLGGGAAGSASTTSVTTASSTK